MNLRKLYSIKKNKMAVALQLDQGLTLFDNRDQMNQDLNEFLDWKDLRVAPLKYGQVFVEHSVYPAATLEWKAIISRAKNCYFPWLGFPK